MNLDGYAQFFRHQSEQIDKQRKISLIKEKENKFKKNKSHNMSSNHTIISCKNTYSSNAETIKSYSKKKKSHINVNQVGNSSNEESSKLETISFRQIQKFMSIKDRKSQFKKGSVTVNPLSDNEKVIDKSEPKWVPKIKKLDKNLEKNEIEAIQTKSSDDEEEVYEKLFYHEDNEQDQSKRSLGIFHPEALIKVCWDLFGYVFIMYQAIITPYRLSFNEPASGFLAVFENLQDFFFIVDILISLNTGTYDKGMLIMDRKFAIVIYLKFWFWIDLLSSFPLAMVISPQNYFDIYPKAEQNE